MEWFGKRKEDNVGSGTRNHAMAVLDTASELGLALTAMAKGDEDAAVKCTERLILSEVEADRIEDRLCADISTGELSFQEREDLIHFVRETDQVANWAKEAALHLQLIIETRSQVPPEIWRELADMAEELTSEVRYLLAVIESMWSDSRVTVCNIDSVNDQERVIDRLYFSAIKHVHLSEMDPKAVMLVRDLISAIESAADSGKSCGDTINILLVSRGS
ncbi:MAG: DUF47 family protein [Methanomethylophilus sp.]